MDYKKLFDLTGKVCIVTGATGYLGNANAKCLKDFGATVVIADIRAEEERWENDGIFKGDMYVQCDISSTESIAAAFKKVADAYGKIDVLVNCANYGGGYGKESFVEFMPDAAFEKGIDGTINATFRCTREVIPYMKEHGGSIINYCSMYGLVSPDLRLYAGGSSRQPANYGAGKAAIDQFTRYCACDLAPYGIRVNAVTPGPFPNPRNQGGEFNEKLANKTMLGRIGQNYEMSGAVLLLASDASSYMTGTNIVVDGGWTAW
ncbi:MAG: SDR family oxidoreductase [Ruminococcaceae bacterium]|nr:SDR family oxidoreductase [Oscillospiraceae bacterium]